MAGVGVSLNVRPCKMLKIIMLVVIRTLGVVRVKRPGEFSSRRFC